MAVAKERLYFTADGELVTEGDPRAAFLAAAPGDDVPDAKRAAKPHNKQAPTPQNKKG